MNAGNSAPAASDDALRRRYLLRRFWRSAAGFWVDEQRYAAWILSASLLLVVLLVVGAAYAMNAWNRAIFDALQKSRRSGSCPTVFALFREAAAGSYG